MLRFTKNVLTPSCPFLQTLLHIFLWSSLLDVTPHRVAGIQLLNTKSRSGPVMVCFFQSTTPLTSWYECDVQNVNFATISTLFNKVEGNRKCDKLSTRAVRVCLHSDIAWAKGVPSWFLCCLMIHRDLWRYDLPPMCSADGFVKYIHCVGVTESGHVKISCQSRGRRYLVTLKLRSNARSTWLILNMYANVSGKVSSAIVFYVQEMSTCYV
jgi:hypothetical protein